MIETYETKLDQLRSMGVISDILIPIKIFNVLLWMENNYKIECVYEKEEEVVKLRHDKDKPLSEQENKLEITDLLIGLSI